MDRQTVIERKTRLDGSVVEFSCEGLVVAPGERAVLRYVTDREWRVADLVLPPGTVTVAHYWVARPYNVYHWLRDGRTVAYYLNVADRTVIDERTVSYRDLVVDVLLHPSGALDVLDEDELPADLDPAARKAIAEAFEAVVTSGRRLAADIDKESRAALARPPGR
ncbi:MAG TPA: DUF402 domain-containing protein [Candidatus Limnocylindria bacterium]|nr:DUF402 domain-containing protein [Candidatus Limnocylindria bacterium]